MVEATVNAPRSPRRKPLVFVFATRGSQWPGMGQELYREEPILRETLRRCDEVTRGRLGWSLEQEFTAGTEAYRLHRSEEHFEPTVVALQIALADIWRARGVRPDAVVGMSGGEFAAGYVAGALGLGDAMDLACSVSLVIRRRLGLGRMVLAGVSLAEAEVFCRTVPRPVYVTAEYGPGATILSGDEEAMQAAAAALAAKGLRSWPVPSEFAFHSPLADSWRGEFLETIGRLSPRPPGIPIYSSVTGGRVDLIAGGGEHWWHVVRKPALYASAVKQLLEEDYGAFLEISPHPMLLRPVEETADLLGKRVTVLPSMCRDRAAGRVLEESLGALRALGYPVIAAESAR